MSVEVPVTILFLVEWYKKIYPSKKAALSLDFVVLPLLIYTLVSIEWLIYCSYYKESL